MVLEPTNTTLGAGLHQGWRPTGVGSLERELVVPTGTGDLRERRFHPANAATNAHGLGSQPAAAQLARPVVARCEADHNALTRYETSYSIPPWTRAAGAGAGDSARAVRRRAVGDHGGGELLEDSRRNRRSRCDLQPPLAARL